MSKFCTSCGAQLDDNATFCTSCGAQLGNSAQPSAAPQSSGATFSGAAAQAGNAMKDTFNKAKDSVNVDAIKDSLSMENIKNLKSNPNKNTIVALGVIAIVAIVVVIILYNLIFAHPYKSALNDLFKGFAEGDGEKIQSAMPKCQIDYMDDNDIDVDEYFDKIAEGVQESLESEYGEDIKITYDIKEEKALKSSKCDDIKKDLKDDYDAKGIKVSKAYKVKLKATIKGDDDKDTDTITLTVAKVDGDWCVVDLSDAMSLGD